MPRARALTDNTPPALFSLAGHPLRWRLLRALACSDLRVRELCGWLGRPQSLVSYHLRLLRRAGVVSSRRSSADGRDAYYRLELDRLSLLLSEAGPALHPGLRLAASDGGTLRPRRRARPLRVLFLCTGNSARSQIAEALLLERSRGTVEVASAGSSPKPLHPDAVRVARELGIDISDRTPKHLSTFGRRRFEFVISLCDRVREVCPEYPGAPQTIHWSIPDPAAAPGNGAFERCAAELDTRIGFFLELVGDTDPSRIELFEPTTP